jgi:hypothetical protein
MTTLISQTSVTDLEQKRMIAGLVADAMAQVASPDQRPVDRKHAEWFLTGLLAGTQYVWRYPTLAAYREEAMVVFRTVDVEIPTPKYSPGRFNPFKKRDHKYRDAFSTLFINRWLNVARVYDERQAYQDKIIKEAIDNMSEHPMVSRPSVEAVTTTHTVPSAVDRAATVADMQQWARDVQTNMKAVEPAINMIASTFDPDEG